MKFKSVNEAVEYIRRESQKGLETRVTDKVAEVITKRAQRDLYGAYRPKYHPRENRLSEEGHIDFTPTGNGVDIAYFQDLGYYDMGERYPNNDIEGSTTTDTVISRFEYGTVWGSADTFLHSPFFTNAENELRGGNIPSLELRKYLALQGFKIK